MVTSTAKIIIFSLDFISVNLSVKHSIVLGLVSAIDTETLEGHDRRPNTRYRTTDKFTLLANGLIQLHEILKNIQYKNSQAEFDFTAYKHGLTAFYGKGPQPLKWDVLRAARGKITISDKPHRLS